MNEEYITIKLDKKEFEILKKALAKDIIDLKFKKTNDEIEEDKRQNEIFKKQRLLYALIFLER